MIYCRFSSSDDRLIFRSCRVPQVELLRETYGQNEFPEIPMKGFWVLFFESFEDTILRVLIAASVVSLGVGLWEDTQKV